MSQHHPPEAVADRYNDRVQYLTDDVHAVRELSVSGPVPACGATPGTGSSPRWWGTPCTATLRWTWAARPMHRSRNSRDACGQQHAFEISGVVATAFDCNIQGEERRVLDLAALLAESVTDELNIADTVSHANPFQMRHLLTEITQQTENIPLAAHFHDTRGMGLENAVAVIEAGVRRFDAALGGLGGCPFAPGATGNIAAEDCTCLLESLGMNTGIDIPALLELHGQLEV